MALAFSLKINDILASHKEVFTDAKYEVTLAHGALTKGNAHKNMPKQFGKSVTLPASTSPAVQDDDQAAAAHQDLELSRRLLTEYLDIINEYDERERLLFGLE